jgi:membrane fusion protein, multidrug efflux system
MTRPIRALAIVIPAVIATIPTAFAQAQDPGRPPPAVIVERIKVQKVTNPSKFTARVEAIAAVDIRARIQGFLQSVEFRDGQTVKAGDLLFKIEPDQFEAIVTSAQAQVSRAEATRESAERSLARNQELFGRKTISQAVLDDAQAAFDVANADVKVAEAALRTAELNLSYAHIIAPIGGEIGRAIVTEGNLVGPEAGPLARIVSLDPIRVAFSLTEGLLITYRQQAKQEGTVDPSAMNFSLRLANGTEYSTPGKVDYVDNEVDPQTGTVAVRLIFPNPDHILIPGQFVTLEVSEKDAPDLPIVPQTAVLQDRDGRFVYVLGDDNAVSQRRIETGARVANGWAVTKGLSGDEPVIVQGIQRLSEGIKVQPSEGQPVGNGQ